MRIGKMVTIVCELELTRTGSNMSTLIEVPVLPYPALAHSTFVTGYQKAVIRANGTDTTSVTKAAAYGGSTNLYFVDSATGRTWGVNQGELVGTGTILISGSYFIAD